MKCRKVSSNLCDFCNRNIETLLHIFYECPVVQNFWGEFQQFLRSKDIQFELKSKTICFGSEDRNNDMLNFLIISAKYFIYCCKIKNTVPSLIHFKQTLKQRQQIEQHIALKSDKLEIVFFILQQ